MERQEVETAKHSRESPESKTSNRQNTLAAQRGFRLGAALSPELGIVTEEPGQTHEERSTEDSYSSTDTHLGEIIFKDTEGSKIIRKIS